MQSLHEILMQLAGGRIGVDEAQAQLMASGVLTVGDFARLDTGRLRRKGVPEIIFAPGKTVGQLLQIAGSLLEAAGRVIIASFDEKQKDAIDSRFPGMIAAGNMETGAIVLAKPDGQLPAKGGAIGVLSAGTADVPACEQARIVAEEMGCRVMKAYDVGVAGVHRLVGPLGEMMEAGVAALVVAAGMEGALPSVVAGLVPVPVIGLPVSSGYGLGGGGVTALLAMLQSCCPGLVVVNIDNGIGAGATAALIANRAAPQKPA